MDVTYDSTIAPDLFSQKASEWFTRSNVFEFTTDQEAIGLLSSADELVDIYLKQLATEETAYSKELLLEFGSALGEALKMIFSGTWQFSSTQNRWIVSYISPLGSEYEVNIFHKLEKRFAVGAEESIAYYFDSIKKLYLEEANAAGFEI